MFGFLPPLQYCITYFTPGKNTASLIVPSEFKDFTRWILILTLWYYRYSLVCYFLAFSPVSLAVPTGVLRQGVITNQLRKAIMHCSRLKNVFNKNRTPETWDSYRKQRNFCVNLLRKIKKEHFKNINVKDINDNKTFWKTIKLFFSSKGLNTKKLMTIENNNLI